MRKFFKKAWAKLVVIFSVVDWRDVAVRSFKTLVQAFVAALGVSIASGNALDVVLLSALSAAIAALWNGVLSPVWKAIGQKADEVIVSETEPISHTDGSMVQVDVSAADGVTVGEVRATMKQATLDAVAEIKKG